MRESLPPYMLIATELRAQIERGDLAPGAQLPSVNELAERYSVARGTVQRALGQLKEWGLADSTPGWGSFVK